MANLENNNDKNKKSAGQNIEDSVQKGIENVQETVKEAAEFAQDAIENPVETAGEFVEQAKKDVVSVKWWAKLLQILFWIALFLGVSFVIVVNLPATKNWAAQKVISKLNDDLKSQISFENVDVNYFGDVTVHKLSVKDNRNFPFLKAEKLYADSNWFSIIFDSRNLQFQSMSVDKMDLKVITYKGDSISNFIRFIGLFDSGKPSVSKTPFKLKTRVYITNSKASIVNQNSEGDAGKWLDAENLNLIVPELRVEGSDVFAQINNLRFTTDRWGKKHFVDTFSADLTLNKQFLFLKDLTLNTPHSLLQGDIKFNLNDGKWADFADRVKWEMQMKQGSQISGYDISYFVTNWDNYKPFKISGNMTGPLNDFRLENFLIGNNDVNIRTDNMKIQHILNGNFLIETNNLSTDFTYKELKAMMPEFISSKMKNFADDFGRLKYNGTARVTPQQVYVSSGDLITGIGQAKITNFYLEDFSEAVPKYKGFAEVNNLNTSVITKSKEVGLISGKFNITGESFDVNTMKISTKSNISKIVILDKEINNVALNGTLDHRRYNGLITLNDEQAKGSVKGLIDFSTSKIKADVNADISHLNINYFAGQPGSQIFSGKLDGKIAMSSLNDMNMDVAMKNVNFSSGIQNYHVDNGSVKAFFENGNRVVSADIPGVINGRMVGKFNLEDLAGMVQNGIGKILVSPAPRKLYKGQQFSLDFTVNQGLVSYFLPDLKIADGATVNGGYNGDTNNLVLNVEASELLYILTGKKQISDADKALSEANPDYKINPRDLETKDSIKLDHFIVRINTENLNEQIFARIDRAEYNQNILKDITLSGRNETGQLLHLSANLKHGTPEEEKEDKLKEYTVNLNQTTDASGNYVFRFEPTQLKFNNVVWAVDTDEQLDHSITYRKNTGDFIIKNLKIFSDDSELFVKNSTFKSGDDFSVDAEVKNFDIGKIFEMQASGNVNQFKGIANGSFSFTKNKNALEPLIDLKVDDIMMNNEDLGNLIISAKNSTAPNVYDIDAKLMSAGLIGDNNLNLTGTVDNNTPSPTLDLTAEMRDFDLAFSQQFVNQVFSNMRGKATGDLKISGPLNDIDYSGDIDLKGFGLKLDFTGVDYSFDDTTISLSKGLAILNDIGVADGRANSKGSISGMIRFETLSSMGVNLVMRADNLLLLDTKQKDFDLFWGRVFGKGDLFVDGPVASLNISTPNMEVLNNSVFTFNSNSTSSVDEFKMLRFLKEDDGGKIVLEEKKKSGANMNLDFTISTDKGTTVNVLVGDNIGDITVRGTADKLRFRMARNGNISMNGDYVVDNGSFVSKAILERKFQITKGSSIRWDGDAMSPELNINAEYPRMVTNAGQYLNMGSLPPVNVLLTARITEKLSNPKIDLDISAKDVSSQVRDALREKMSNEDEKIIQIGSVLALGTFSEGSGGFGIDVGKTSENMGYNMLLKQLGSVFNTISEQLQVDLTYLNDAASNSERANASFSYALSPRISLKTDLGIPLSRSENVNANMLSAGGTVEYDVSKNNDGSRLLRFYSKPSNIGMATNVPAGANQSYGAGVVYSKSFNTLFKKSGKNKKSKTKNTTIIKDSVKNDTVK
ncbi:MAG: translocation/assembly module TamB [Bergeyella sp.]